MNTLDPKGYYLHRHLVVGEEYDGHLYHIRHRDTGTEAHGRLGVTSWDSTPLGPKTSHLYVDGFYSNKEGHASKEGEPRQNYFGPAGVRAIGRALKEHYPNVTKLTATRVSGVRKVSPAPDTYSGVTKNVNLSKALDPKGFYLSNNHKDESDSWYQSYDIKHRDTADEKHGYLSAGRSQWKPGRLYISAFGSTRLGTKSKGGYDNQNYFGVAGIKAIKRSLSEHYPDIKEISAERVSGMRQVSGKGGARVDRRLEKALPESSRNSKYYLRESDKDDRSEDGTTYHEFRVVHRDTGKDVGGLNTEYGGKHAEGEVHISWVDAYDKPSNFHSRYEMGRHAIGAAHIRPLIKELRRHIPEMTHISGNRVSGIRRGPAAKQSIRQLTRGRFPVDDESTGEGVPRKVAIPSKLMKSEYRMKAENPGREDKYSIVRGEPSSYGDNWHIKDKKTGEHLGRLSIEHGEHGGVEGDDKDTLHVAGFYSAEADRAMDNTVGQHVFGPAGIRELARHIKKLYPGKKHVQATRISGIRNESGRREDETVYKHNILKAIVLEEHPRSSTAPRKVWNIKDTNSGRRIGRMTTSKHLWPGGILRIHNFSTFGGPQSLGPAGLRQVHQELQRNYPGVKGYSGFRVSGARAQANVPGPVKITVPSMYKSIGTDEAIHSAAIKVGDHVYEGKTHREAAVNALRGGEKKEDVSRSLLLYEANTGFTTTSGRYVSRNEAKTIAVKGKQLSSGVDPKASHFGLDSGDVIYKALTIKDTTNYLNGNGANGFHSLHFRNESSGVYGHVHYFIEGNKAHITDVGAVNPADPEHSTYSQASSARNSVGPKDILQLQHYVVKKHGVSGFSAHSRMTGTRNYGKEVGRNYSIQQDLPQHRALGKAISITGHNAEEFRTGVRDETRTRHYYDFENHAGIKGRVDMELKDNNETAYIHTIRAYHPTSSEYLKGANLLGPKDVIGLKNQLLERHPTIKRFATKERVSGARFGVTTRRDSIFSREGVPVKFDLPPNRLAKALTITHDMSHKSDYDPNKSYHAYNFDKEGSSAKGRISFTIDHASGEAKISNIWNIGGPPKVGQYWKGANTLGPADVMQLQRHIVKQHPEIRVFKGNRISGARRQVNVKAQNVIVDGAQVVRELPKNRRAE